MPVILAKWVLESELPSWKTLSPFGGLLVPEDPAAHILGLDNEDAVARNNHMIYLGGAIRRWDGDIVELVIDRFVEHDLVSQRAESLAHKPFEHRHQTHFAAPTRSEATNLPAFGYIDHMPKYIGHGLYLHQSKLESLVLEKLSSS